MIGVGIVGCNYGSTVLIPAFRRDPRCEVVALAGTDAARTARVALSANIARGLISWQTLVEDPAVAVVAVAVPPYLQPAIAQYALKLGKAVFLEKPLAADLEGAQTILESARNSNRPTIIDFNFPELSSWRRAKKLLDEGAIGRLHNAVVTWNFMNRAARLRVESWKTRDNGGGGLLGNFVSHCFHNLEWLCGPIAGLAGRAFALPDRNLIGNIAFALAFTSGAGGTLQVNSASSFGSGHRIELYGENGTLFLSNPTSDYFRGFELKLGRQGDEVLKTVTIENGDEDQFSDSRIGPVTRLVGRFIDAYEAGGSPSPGIAAGFRVQCLIDAAQRAHAVGHWIDVAPPGREGAR